MGSLLLPCRLVCIGRASHAFTSTSLCARGRGKEHAVTVSSGDKEDDKEDDKKDDKKDFGGSAWMGIRGWNNDGNVGAGSSHAMDIS